jgi:hypothetical protein
MHRRDLRTSLLLGLVCLLVYNANLRSISAGDTYPARYLPFGIWRYGTVLLDPISTITAQGWAIRPVAAQGRPISAQGGSIPAKSGLRAFWIVRGRGGHAISLYPVVLPVLIAPLYLPAVGYLHWRGWTEQELERTAKVMEKLTASLLAAAAAALLYLLLRRRADPRTAVLLTLAFAFGTTTWVISSQALWQHGLAELLVIGTLLLVTGPCTARRALAAGILCGLIACNRPPDTILAAALGLYAVWWAGRLVPLLAVGAVLPLGMILAYNLEVAGKVAGGYGLSGSAAFFRHDLLSGIAGLLFSPTRGLFIFSPFLLFLPFGWRQLPRDRGDRHLTLALGGAAILQVLLYAKADWRAGASWGPRWLTDLLPILLWMLAPAVAALRGAGRLAFVLATCAAIAIEAVGAFWYTGASDLAIFAAATDADPLRAAWNPRNAPFLAELRHAPAPGELTLAVAGNLDSIRIAPGPPAPPAPPAPFTPGSKDFTPGSKDFTTGSKDLTPGSKDAASAPVSRRVSVPCISASRVMVVVAAAGRSKRQRSGGRTALPAAGESSETASGSCHRCATLVPSGSGCGPWPVKRSASRRRVSKVTARPAIGCGSSTNR